MSTDLRILCVDDQRAFVEALSIALNAERGLAVVATAPDIDTALQIVASEPVDVVVMDVDLPRVDGIEGTRQIKRLRPDVRVVVLTAFASLDGTARAIAAGADAYLSKDTPMDEVARTVRAPSDRPLALDQRAIDTLRDTVDPVVNAERRMRLTDREREILALLATGLDSRLIAQQLHIGTQTCRGYIRNVLTKLGAHSQLEAVAVARRRGILQSRAS
ncbi:MAG TPA: response regulator transcription factor [Acidimicrobiales bacterium]|nr:response regulator transcription factor [Acidimicrobiales bacterium]